MDWTVGRIRRISQLLVETPRFAWNWWRALSALESKDWDLAIKHLGAIQTRGFGDDDTHYRRGWAFVMQERWSEALGEFEQISGTLSKPSIQAFSIFNHCLALAHLGRFEEAQAMLRACPEETWPPNLQPSVVQLEQYIAHKTPNAPRPVH